MDIIHHKVIDADFLDIIDLLIASITNVGAIYLVYAMFHWVIRLNNTKTDLQPLIATFALIDFDIWLWSFENIIGYLFLNSDIPLATLSARILFMIGVYLQVRFIFKLGIAAPLSDIELEKLDYDGRLILIIDDNKSLGNAFQKILEKAGFNSEYVTNVPDALTIIGLEIPNMMIVDIGLPGANVVDFCDKARALGFEGPSIAISGMYHRIDVSPLKEACFSEFINKPISADRLISAVKSYLNPKVGA